MQSKAKFLTITQAAEFLKVSPDTLRRWEDKGLVAPQRTKGGSRRYTLLDLKIARLNKRKTKFFQISSLLTQNYINSRQDLKIALITSFLWIFALLSFHFLTPIFLRPTNPEQRIISEQLKEQNHLKKASETTPSEASFLLRNELNTTKVSVNTNKPPVVEKIFPPTAGTDLLIGHSLPALEYSNVINQYYSLQPLPKNESPTLIIKKVDPLFYHLI